MLEDKHFKEVKEKGLLVYQILNDGFGRFIVDQNLQIGVVLFVEYNIELERFLVGYIDASKKFPLECKHTYEGSSWEETKKEFNFFV